MLLAALVATYSLAAYSLDLLTGDLGLPVICQSVAIAIGAYSSALLTTDGWPVVLAAAVGSGLGGALYVLIGFAGASLVNDRFLLFTFALQSLGSNVLDNATGLTHGPSGVAGIPPLLSLGDDWARLTFLAGAVGSLFVAQGVVVRIRVSALGRVLVTLRESEEIARAFGKNTRSARLTTFFVSGALAAVAGSILAHGLGFIDPSMFTASESVMLLSMVIAGGAGTNGGPLLGTVAIMGIPEGLRYLGFRGDFEAHIRQALFGLLLVVLVLARPRWLPRSRFVT